MNFQNELETLIRARYPILYIVSSEEMRVQELVVEVVQVVMVVILFVFLLILLIVDHQQRQELF